MRVSSRGALGFAATVIVVVALVATLRFSAAASGSGVPFPETTLMLPTGAYFHIQSLPLGIMPGSIVGDVSFDSSGSRAVFIATFPGAALFGDPERMDPSQAFLLELQTRRLTQLTSDGFAQGARWSGPNTISIRDADLVTTLTLGAEGDTLGGFSLPDHRMSADQTLVGAMSDVTPPDSDRLSIYMRSDGSYVVRQIGARRRVEGVAAHGAFVLLGESIAWVDSSARRAPRFMRAGEIDALAPHFDDAFGRLLTPIVPLGRAVYQGAYRDGVAYFVFAYGLTRVVAATRDFVKYSYPLRPSDPAYSVGDGFGALAGANLYFAWPEGSALTVERSGTYATVPLTLPTGYSDVQPLIAAADSKAQTDLWPALQPDSDALDAAVLQWRVYPAGAADGAHWIASYLGRVYLGDALGQFVRATAPAFPFAVLSRSDDGTLWGASFVDTPCDRSSIACPDRALLWSSHDGTRWRVRYSLDGSPGAVGATAGDLWVAETRPVDGVPMICVAPLAGDASPTSYVTGATYAGEQLFLAALPAGTYLVWGSTPGRAAGAEGSLSAFRLDRSLLATADDAGLNVFRRLRRAASAQNAFGGFGDPSMLDSTVSELQGVVGVHAVLATDIADPIVPPGLILRTIADEKRWETEFGARPVQLGIVSARPEGTGAIVTRAIWRGPLRGHGATELWQRDSSGVWRWARTLHSWVL
jgi:hypothetical protein